MGSWTSVYLDYTTERWGLWGYKHYWVVGLKAKDGTGAFYSNVKGPFIIWKRSRGLTYYLYMQFVLPQLKDHSMSQHPQLRFMLGLCRIVRMATLLELSRNEFVNKQQEILIIYWTVRSTQLIVWKWIRNFLPASFPNHCVRDKHG